MDDHLTHRVAGRTVRLLSQAMTFRAAKQSVISSNLANIDTPGYRPKEATFNKALQEAVEKNALRLKTTHRKHFPVGSVSTPSGRDLYTIETQKSSFGQTNQLNIDREMAEMSKNNLLYEASARLLSNKFEALRSAIVGSGR